MHIVCFQAMFCVSFPCIFFDFFVYLGSFWVMFSGAYLSRLVIFSAACNLQVNPSVELYDL